MTAAASSGGRGRRQPPLRRKRARRTAAAAALAASVGLLALGFGARPAAAGGASAAGGTGTGRPGAASAPAAKHGLTRTERGVLLVTLTFLVGGGLLESARGDGADPGGERRPAITLYDDPALVCQEAPPSRPPGDPPPLR